MAIFITSSELSEEEEEEEEEEEKERELLVPSSALPVTGAAPALHTAVPQLPIPIMLPTHCLRVEKVKTAAPAPLQPEAGYFITCAELLPQMTLALSPTALIQLPTRGALLLVEGAERGGG